MLCGSKVPFKQSEATSPSGDGEEPGKKTNGFSLRVAKIQAKGHKALGFVARHGFTL
jgi:hypothetical protein